MSDNLTIQGFSNLFTYTMQRVLQDLYDFSPTSLFLILGISLVLNIFFLKLWFDNRAKHEALLEMVQSLQTDTKILKKEVRTLKKDMNNLTNKTQSMEVLSEMVQTDSDLLKGKFSSLEKDTVGAETLFERIRTVEFINQTVEGI